MLAPGRAAAGVGTRLQRAVASHQQGRLEEAEAGYRSVLAAMPGQPDAMWLLGAVLLQRGRPGDAVPRLEAALRRKPGMVDAWLALANARVAVGSALAATSAYRAAQCLEPDRSAAAVNHVAALVEAERHREGLERARRAGCLSPGHVGAWSNAGVAAIGLDRADEAVMSFQRALVLVPDHTEAWRGLGYTARSVDDTDGERAAFERGVVASDGDPEIVDALGVARSESGDGDGAIEAWREVLEQTTGHERAHARIALELWYRGEWSEAARTVVSEMAARRAPGATVPADDPTIVKTGRTKLLHTAEQLEHLLDLGLVDQRLAPVAEEARRLSDAVPADRLTDLAALDPSDDLFAHYNRLIHVEEERPIPGGALSRGRDWSAVEGAFGDGGDQAVRLDDLLTPEAHEGIRRFATRSTIWFENRYAEEVGGRLAMGLACPLLFQVAGELRDALPDLLGPLRLRTIFGYVYYQSGSDGHLHADQGVLDDRQAVSLNYWVTPDEANLDPGQGGLTVWNRRAPEAYFKEPDAATRRAMLEAELSKPGTARRRIPYAGNRAMLFRSDILHKSEPMTFREGLLNRRVSLTFIFGARR